MRVLYATSNKGKLMEGEQILGKYGVEVMSPKELGIEMEVPESGATLEANAAMKVRWYGEKLKIKNEKLKIEENSDGERPSIESGSNPQILNSSQTRLAQVQNDNQLETRNQKPETDLIIMADDEGLAIDALGEEPGVKVRRWKDGVTRMSDEEIVEFCLQKMQVIPPEARGATFRTVMVLALPRDRFSVSAFQRFSAHSTGSVQVSQESNNLLSFEDTYDVEYFSGKLRGIILNEPKEVKIEGYPFAGLFYVPDWGMTVGEMLKLPEAERVKYKTHRRLALDQALERMLEWGALLR